MPAQTRIAEILSKTQTRSAMLSAVGKEDRSVDLSFSSEEEYERWYGIEILSHEPGACDLSRLNNSAAFLFNHDRNQVLGVVDSASVGNDKMGRAHCRFGSSAEAENRWPDVRDGITKNASVGYIPLEAKLIETREGDIDVYLITKWQPFEISIVTVPADATVGVGRELEPENTMPNRTKQFRDADKGGPSGGSVPVTAAPEPAPAPSAVSIETERSAAITAERNRANAIRANAAKFKAPPEMVERALSEGWSNDKFREELLEHVEKRNAQIIDATSPIGLNQKELKEFRLLRLLNAITSPLNERERFMREAAFELEACAAAADKIKHRQVNGTVIPTDILMTPLQQRDANIIGTTPGAGYISTGGAMVPTTLLSQSFIEILRNKALLLKRCSELAGLVGNFEIPKQLTGTAGYWIGEDASAPTDDIEFGVVPLSPKTCAVKSEITRRMLMQTSIGVEALVRKNLARGLALAIDRAGFYGDGTANQPTGILGTDGIGAVAFAAANPTFPELVEMETLVAMANADVESMFYFANARFRGTMKTAQKFPGAPSGITIWEPGGTVNGYGTEITNQINTGDVFFGNFEDLIIGLWGGLEITTDPFTHSDKGRIRIVTMQDVDFAVQRTQSFVYGTYTAPAPGGGE